MANRALNVVAWVTATPVFLGAILLWLVFAAACLFVAVAGLADIFGVVDNVGGPWQKVALLLIFVRVVMTGWRVGKLNERIDQIRMCVFATTNYLNIEFRNRRTDLPPGLGELLKDDLLQGVFRDKLLDGTYAARDRRKVTLADDIRSMLGNSR